MPKVSGNVSIANGGTKLTHPKWVLDYYKKKQGQGETLTGDDIAKPNQFLITRGYKDAPTFVAFTGVLECKNLPDPILCRARVAYEKYALVPSLAMLAVVLVFFLINMVRSGNEIRR